MHKMDFFSNARFHHLGLAVRDIGEDLHPIYDPVQKVSVAFVDMHGVTVELIKPEGDDSPAKNFIGKGIYHLCYEVGNISKAIKEAEQKGWKCVQSPVSAKAFQEKSIAWLVHRQFGLIEFLER